MTPNPPFFFQVPAPPTHCRSRKPNFSLSFPLYGTPPSRKPLKPPPEIPPPFHLPRPPRRSLGHPPVPTGFQHPPVRGISFFYGRHSRITLIPASPPRLDDFILSSFFDFNLGPISGRGPPSVMPIAEKPGSQSHRPRKLTRQNALLISPQYRPIRKRLDCSASFTILLPEALPRQNISEHDGYAGVSSALF